METDDGTRLESARGRGAWRQILVVYRKELTDILRDRRALISMIVAPLLLIPLLIFGLGVLSYTVMEQARQEVHRVMLLGGADSPRAVERLAAHEGIVLVEEAEDYEARILARDIRAAVRVPEGFEEAVIEDRAAGTVTLYTFEGEVKSGMAARLVREVLGEFRQEVVRDRLREREISPELLEPFALATENVAPPEKVTGTTLGGVIPYLVILLCVTGAMYPAMDLTAGEKERGTMETILSSPVSRWALVLGKYFVVVTASVATALLSIVSLGAVLVFGFTLLDQAEGQVDAIMAIDPFALVAVFFLLLPVACLFSAVLLAFSLFARSFKEAQSYVSPLLLLAILPAIAATLPGMEINSALIWAPVLNIALVSKEMMIGSYDWAAIGIVFGTTCIYALIALLFAVRLFHRESVVFRS